MNLRQCEVFRAVMEAGSVTAAAERLHVSQPAVSKMLGLLERDLGFRVFLRERQRLVPTPEAQALYSEIRRAFVGLDYLTRFAGDLRDMRQGHLAVAASHAVSSEHMPGIVAAFLRRHPGLSVSLQAMDSPGVAQAVETGRVDLGLAQFETPATALRRERLCAMEAVCVMPPGHALARRRVIRPADLHGQDFVALAAVNRLRTRLEALLEEHGAAPRIRVDTPLASTACGLVAQGVGICVLDRLSAEANLRHRLVLRPLRPGLSEELLLLLPARGPLSNVAAAFAQALRERYTEEAGAAVEPPPRRRGAPARG
ncbi:MAG TPA: LysR substrate-binding domain-containing protein [Roseomonas sp.]|nr:LysR substrate-binding domain-containing protein [Roseomonas sp.]